MRTSNKILLGVFLAILVTLTGIYGAVYAKYRNNDFITSTRLHQENYDTYKIDGVQSVSLIGLDHVTIIPSDSARIEIEKIEGAKTLHTFINGSLVVKGDTTITYKDGTTNRERSYRDIIIYLPLAQNIKSDFCNLSVKGAKDSTKAPVIQLELDATELQLGYFNREDVLSPEKFKSIVISKANGGLVEVSNNSVINKMELNLQSGRFEDGGATFDSLSVAADTNSTITITGKNISKTTFISKP